MTGMPAGAIVGGPTKAWIPGTGQEEGTEPAAPVAAQVGPIEISLVTYRALVANSTLAAYVAARGRTGAGVSINYTSSTVVI